MLQKLSDAVDKKYNPHHTIEDKELSILILKFGGPSLLEILHRAKVFPSPSTAYRFLDERKIEMKSHISFDVEDMIVQALRNVVNADTSDSVFVMCKMDGTYGNSRIRWNPNDDHLYGFCWEHSSTKCLVFDNIENIESLAQHVINKEIHIPKEMFVLGLSTTMGLLVPAIVAPVCTHSNKAAK